MAEQVNEPKAPITPAVLADPGLNAGACARVWVNGKPVATPEEAAAASKSGPDKDDDKPKAPQIPTHETHPA